MIPNNMWCEQCQGPALRPSGNPEAADRYQQAKPTWAVVEAKTNQFGEARADGFPQRDSGKLPDASDKRSLLVAVFVE